MNNRDLLQAVLRNSLSAFIQKTFQTISPGVRFLPNWHIDAIAHFLDACYRGEIKRLIITLPPRYLKSISVSVAYVAWLLGKDPSYRIIGASYSQDLANKMALDTRTVMSTHWFRELFPHTRFHPGKNSQAEFMTTKQGFRLATSVGGTLTGRGGNMMIVDDPHKAEDVFSDARREAVISWFINTLLSRLDSKGRDCIILIQQRLHENDLAGYLLNVGGWTHLNLPAIAEEEQWIPIGDGNIHLRKPGDILHPARESAEILTQMKETMGSYAFAAQYQQRPAPLDEGLIRWEWIKFYDHLPARRPGDLIIQSWDTASTVSEMSDYSVCTTWLCHDNRYYLIDVHRERIEYPELRKRVQMLAAHFGANAIIIEAAGSGISLIQDLRAHIRLNIMDVKHVTDKGTRMMAESPTIEAGRVLVPVGAPWLADFQHEIANFPNGKHDDQVDSLSQFLYWARLRENNGYRPQSRLTLITKERASPSAGDIFNMRIW